MLIAGLKASKESGSKDSLKKKEEEREHKQHKMKEGSRVIDGQSLYIFQWRNKRSTSSFFVFYQSENFMYFMLVHFYYESVENKLSILKAALLKIISIKVHLPMNMFMKSSLNLKAAFPELSLQKCLIPGPCPPKKFI